jgi:hypothetical protein
MAIDKPLLSRTSGQTTSGIADRVVGLSNNTLTLSPTDNQTADNASGKSQPPQGFDGPVPDALTGKIPERATAGSVTSSNDDRQAAVNDKLGLVDQASAIDALLGRGARIYSAPSAPAKPTGCPALIRVSARRRMGQPWPPQRRHC